MIQHASDGFAIIAALAGLWAALQWWHSGRVRIRHHPEVDLTTMEGMIDPRHTAATSEAVERTEVLNTRAAAWTAISIAAQAIATILGRLVPHLSL